MTCRAFSHWLLTPLSTYNVQVALLFFSLSLSLTIDMPLVTAAVPPTRAPMKGVGATKPSDTLSPGPCKGARVHAQDREKEGRRAQSATATHQARIFIQPVLGPLLLLICHKLLSAHNGHTPTPGAAARTLANEHQSAPLHALGKPCNMPAKVAQ